MLSKKSQSPKGCIVYDSIYITSLKRCFLILKWWNGEFNPKILGIKNKLVVVRGEGKCPMMGGKCEWLQQDNMKDPCSDVSWLHQYQHPGCDLILQFCEMFPLGAWLKSTQELYCFLKLHNLQLDYNKFTLC